MAREESRALISPSAASFLEEYADSVINTLRSKAPSVRPKNFAPMSSLPERLSFSPKSRLISEILSAELDALNSRSSR